MAKIPTVRVYHPEFPGDRSQSIVINKSVYEADKERYKICKEPRKNEKVELKDNEQDEKDAKGEVKKAAEGGEQGPAGDASFTEKLGASRDASKTESDASKKGK